MASKVFCVELTDAAWDTLNGNQGSAPPSKWEGACPDCGARGWVTAQVTRGGLEIEAPCEHLLARFSPSDPDPAAYLVWGGRRGYSVLPLDVAQKMGWRYAQGDAGLIEVLGHQGETVVGLLLDGEEPDDKLDLDFLRGHLRVAHVDGGRVAVFRPLEH